MASAAAPDGGAGLERLGREHEAIVAEIIGRRVSEWGFAVAQVGNVLNVRLGCASYRVTVTAEGTPPSSPP